MSPTWNAHTHDARARLIGVLVTIRTWPHTPLNDAAVAHARAPDRRPPVRARQRLGRGRSPTPTRRTPTSRTHSWDEYAAWHLGLTEGANDETKARYAFVYGDFRRVHRTGLIACVYRASEWRHKDVELAAHDLLQHLDRTIG